MPVPHHYFNPQVLHEDSVVRSYFSVSGLEHSVGARNRRAGGRQAINSGGIAERSGAGEDARRYKF